MSGSEQPGRFMHQVGEKGSRLVCFGLCWSVERVTLIGVDGYCPGNNIRKS